MGKTEDGKNYKFEDLSTRKDDANSKFNFFTLTPPHNTDMLVYQSGHKNNCIPGWYTKPTTYDHYIIHYVLSGKGTYHAPSKSYSIKKGDLFLIKPFESIDYQADFTEPWTYYWVGFNGHNALNLLKRCGYDENSLVRSYHYDEKLKAVFHMLAYPKLTSIAREYELLGNLYQMFSLLIHTHASQPVSSSEQYLKAAIEYIQQHYPSSDLKVSDIANYIGIDRTYLYRLFQDTFHQSIQDFILNFRLQKAKNLLKYSGLSIGVIAFSCGFENQSYFSNIFKKRFQQTPLQYRKKHIETK
ncbi:MAG: AraC family transcriptional regulator [Lachnospiraceae bacterium]|nr:AraC family transcriptional regulator [Lachnospiraceae bacterium]